MCTTETWLLLYGRNNLHTNIQFTCMCKLYQCINPPKKWKEDEKWKWNKMWVSVTLDSRSFLKQILSGDFQLKSRQRKFGIHLGFTCNCVTNSIVMGEPLCSLSSLSPSLPLPASLKDSPSSLFWYSTSTKAHFPTLHSSFSQLHHPVLLSPRKTPAFSSAAVSQACVVIPQHCWSWAEEQTPA